jgi:chromosomal replication initiator protein
VEAAVSNLVNSSVNLPIVNSELWNEVKAELRSQYGEAVYRNWIEPINFESYHGGIVKIAAPSRFKREWFVNNYQQSAKEMLCGVNPSIFGIEVLIKLQEESQTVQEVKVEDRELSFITQDLAAQNAATLDAMGAALDPRYTFDNFVVGKANELAHAAARRLAGSEECIAGCNPLFLYGGVGLGKTHLMHAIAWHIRQYHPNRKVVYLSAEKFMYQFIKALRFNETMTFKEQFRSVDVLMVDDVQFISGKDSTQEEFFHTFNALVDQNKQLVFSADRSPSDLEGIEERIRSRLGWGLVADIHGTSYELRYGILQSKVEQVADITVPHEVLEFLAQRITSNVRELEGALNRVIAHATLVGTPISLNSTEKVLQDLLRSCEKKATIDDIQRKVAEYYNIKLSDMHSARRSSNIARPRQVAMYLCKQVTSRSLPEIGRKFGGKDHTTVMHAIKRVQELMAEDVEIREDVARLQRSLNV